VTARENASLVLHTVSSADPISRASRRAAEDVLRLDAALAPFLSANPYFITIGAWEGVELRVELSRGRAAREAVA
jgi:hypothetical protein